MQTVPVSLRSNPYEIVISSGIFDQFGEYFLKWTRGAKNAIVVTDSNVEPLYGLKIAEILADAGVNNDLCVVEAGEESKCVDVAAMLWERLIECGADRKTVVVAVGGGVVGDLAGFVAATLNRGLPFIQVPTTLLAQVDSSVGGKTGINIPQGKNLVGAFWQPKGVLMDTQTLTTLDDRQYRAGLAEVVKYGVILDANFFNFLVKMPSWKRQGKRAFKAGSALHSLARSATEFRSVSRGTLTVVAWTLPTPWRRRAVAMARSWSGSFRVE